MINSRAKGKAGEHELIKLLHDHLGVKLQRNLVQTRSGGYDLVGLDGYAIECKRAKEADLNNWWKQAHAQADDNMPVLAYRLDRMDWRFVVPIPTVDKKNWDSVDWTMELSVHGFCYLVREVL